MVCEVVIIGWPRIAREKRRRVEHPWCQCAGCSECDHGLPNRLMLGTDQPMRCVRRLENQLCGGNEEFDNRECHQWKSKREEHRVNYQGEEKYPGLL